jgi:hypothetical protein
MTIKDAREAALAEYRRKNPRYRDDSKLTRALSDVSVPHPPVLFIAQGYLFNMATVVESTLRSTRSMVLSWLRMPPSWPTTTSHMKTIPIFLHIVLSPSTTARILSESHRGPDSHQNRCVL